MKRYNDYTKSQRQQIAMRLAKSCKQASKPRTVKEFLAMQRELERDNPKIDFTHQRPQNKRQ